MSLVYTKPNPLSLAFSATDEDTKTVVSMVNAVKAGDKAASILSAATVLLVANRVSTFDQVVPTDRNSVEGGLKAWRKTVWTTAFWQLADTINMPANVRKKIAPYVSDLGSALWLKIPLTDGDKVRAITAIRDDLAEFRESKSPAERIVSAVNSVAPIKNGAVSAIWTRHDAAIACALLTAEQIAAMRELIYLMDGKPFVDADGE